MLANTISLSMVKHGQLQRHGITREQHWSRLVTSSKPKLIASSEHVVDTSRRAVPQAAWRGMLLHAAGEGDAPDAAVSDQHTTRIRRLRLRMS